MAPPLPTLTEIRDRFKGNTFFLEITLILGQKLTKLGQIQNKDLF